MEQYTQEQIETAQRTYRAIAKAPKDKRTFAQVLAEAFIAGMTAQEQITANAQRSHVGT